MSLNRILILAAVLAGGYAGLLLFRKRRAPVGRGGSGPGPVDTGTGTGTGGKVPAETTGGNRKTIEPVSMPSSPEIISDPVGSLGTSGGNREQIRSTEISIEGK